jgi:hypothetical protein
MRARPEDGQLSMVGVVIALAVVGMLSAVGLTVFLTGGGNPQGSSGPQGAGIATADDVYAKSSLSQAQTAASTSGVLSGYGGDTASALSSSDPSLNFTAGPSGSSGTVSVAPSSGEGPGGAASPGSVMLSAYSKTGTCWYVWLGSGGPLYAAVKGRSSCQAVPEASAPVGFTTTWPAS